MKEYLEVDKLPISVNSGNENRPEIENRGVVTFPTSNGGSGGYGRVQYYNPYTIHRDNYRRAIQTMYDHAILLNEGQVSMWQRIKTKARNILRSTQEEWQRFVSFFPIFKTIGTIISTWFRGVLFFIVAVITACLILVGMFLFFPGLGQLAVMEDSASNPFNVFKLSTREFISTSLTVLQVTVGTYLAGLFWKNI